MDRRTALKNLALVVAGTALLPACTQSNPIVHYTHFDLHLDQQKLITDMAETIIPKTNTPGATDLGLDKFVIMMVDDCAKKEDRDVFFAGMTKFNDLIQKTHNKSFADCSAIVRQQILSTLDNADKNKPKATNADKDKKKTPPDELMVFFNTVKSLTVFGYTQSQFFMTKEVVYELVPGHYTPYVPVVNNLAQLKNV